MPTYDYVCQACGHELELVQSMRDSPKRKCPECGRLKLKRLIGAGAAIVFKGSGFYQTDYRTQSYKDGEKKAKSESEGASKGEAKDSKDSKDSKGSKDSKDSKDSKATKASEPSPSPKRDDEAS